MNESIETKTLIFSDFVETYVYVDTRFLSDDDIRLKKWIANFKNLAGYFLFFKGKKILKFSSSFFFTAFFFVKDVKCSEFDGFREDKDKKLKLNVLSKKKIVKRGVGRKLSDPPVPDFYYLLNDQNKQRVIDHLRSKNLKITVNDSKFQTWMFDETLNRDNYYKKKEAELILQKKLTSRQKLIMLSILFGKMEYKDFLFYAQKL